MKIILGSASRWRRELLEQAKLNFEVMHADIDERAYHDEDTAKLVLTIARAKADVLLQKIREPALLITLDQAVQCDRYLHNKPETAQDVKTYLHRYQQYPAVVYNGIIVTNTFTQKQVTAVDIGKVYFNPIPEDVIEKIIEQGDVFHCAGAFQIEGDSLFQPYFAKIEGSIDGIKGIPVQLVKKMLLEATI